MSNDASSSARALRSQLRESTREASRLRLLEAAALAAADERQPPSALRLALAHAQSFLAADTALALQLEAGGLTVQAAQGFALPPGARVTAAGLLGSALRAPVLVRERAVSPLRMVGREVAAVEVLMPLRIRGQVTGLLALSSGRPIALPDAADTVTLQAFAAILAAVIEEPRSPRAPRAPRREATALLSRLTAREQQVLSLLPRGLSNAELAQQLGIAPGTAKVHVERILHKLGVRDRTQAAVRATEWGLGK
jgi:DNA-binding CsgD family transcriptional regulator